MSRTERQEDKCMNYPLKKVVSVNGQDFLMDTHDIALFHRTIYIFEEINEETAKAVISALLCLDRESEDDITIRILSPGGSVHAGFAIYDTIRALRSDVCTVACGLAASMAAFLLAAAGTKGKRWAHPNAEVLIHQPLGGAIGQASDIRIHAEHILRIRERLNRILAECTGQSVEKIDRDTERDYIMQAEEALAYGIVDHIGDPAAEQ